MKFAYADPPYLGCGKRYDHPEALKWNTVEAHNDLIQRLVSEYPDGWAMSASSPSLAALLPLCPKDVRVLAWVKPFAAFKPGVGLAYTWEPVIFRGGRKIDRKTLTVKDHVIESITLKKGLCGAKPVRFCEWILRAFNYQPGDIVDDLFPGTGIFTQTLERIKLNV